MSDKLSIFSNDKFVGYVSKVTTDSCFVQIPSSTLINPFWDNGKEYVAGIVGTYVIIEGLNDGFLGKIREVSIPEDEIKRLNEDNQNTIKKKETFKRSHPYAVVDFLLCFDFYEMIPKKGIPTFPLVSSKVYLCNEEFLEQIISNKTEKSSFDIATLQNLSRVNINIKQSALFGRHCAIIGNTGGGKSWTVARLIEETIKGNDNKKVILIDATGEYSPFSKQALTTPIYFGDIDNLPERYTSVNYNYRQLTIADLQIMLRPSLQSQTPVLLESVKSLKIVNFVLNKTETYKFKNTNDSFIQDFRQIYEVDSGVLRKANRPKQLFLSAIRDLKTIINKDDNDYDISFLVDQIKEECVYESDFNSNSSNNKFGGANNKDYGNQTTLISRIISMLDNPILNAIFEFRQQSQPSSTPVKFIDCLNTFLSSDNKMMLIDLSQMGFDYNVREILVNIIGKELLKRARKANFKEIPTIVFLDEAHQFLNKKLQDSFSENIELNAFDLIAKECRKYGLYVCIATQMPRDIPIGTLSQVGTFIIHRLINDQDIDKIKGSCSETNRWILSGLANLSSGEAIISSINLPFPLTIKIKEPHTKPISQAPIELLDSHKE